MEKNKTGKYFKYAVGEIILVVIGILIALWLNNLNQQSNELQERAKLKIELKEELVENKVSFKKYKDYVEQCHKKVIAVLNVSTNKSTEISMDKLRVLVNEMIPLNAIYINQSRLNSAKTSGQFGLLTSEESSALAAYETALDNFIDSKESIGLSIEDNMPLFLHFSTLDLNYKKIFPDESIPKHPYYNLSDEDFLAFLKTRETYDKLNIILLGITLDFAWLKELDGYIDKTIAVLNLQSDDYLIVN
jgi:hypothetical protein